METKIILPTSIKSCFQEKEGEPGRFCECQYYDQYEFTIAEAIDYMAYPWRAYLFEDMILHNVNMRNEMRRLGAKKLIEYIRSNSNPNEDVESQMRQFIHKWDGKELANIDIQVVPITEPFVIDDVMFEGLGELQASVERSYGKCSMDEDKPKEEIPDITPKCHVGFVWKEYPRFDIYDMGDDRIYSNFLIRKQPILDEDLRAVNAIARFNFCAVKEDTPEHLLPLVYYEGSDGFMLIAQKHK